MNVYSKLQQARVKLQSSALKKSGKNKHQNYEYFELGDFLPSINKIFNELKLFSSVSFTSELATLKVVNSEKPDEVIEFTSPMAEAELRGVQPIQNLGAIQTYQRRYLYMNALEIVEHDALDPLPPEDKPTKSKANYRDDYVDKALELGFEFEELELLATKTGKKAFNELTDSTFKALLERFAEGDEAVIKAKEFVKGAK